MTLIFHLKIHILVVTSVSQYYKLITATKSLPPEKLLPMIRDHNGLHKRSKEWFYIKSDR